MAVDWDLVRVFLVIARQGQMLAAARRLGLSHATVARKLTELEKQLGSLLVNRRPSGSVLTDAGTKLFSIAERIEAEFVDASTLVGTQSSKLAGTIRIGAPDGFGNYFLARVLRDLVHSHAGLIVELIPLPRAFSLSQRDADIVITLDRPTQGRSIVSKLDDMYFGFYGAQSYIQKFGLPKTVEQLSEHVHDLGCN